MSFIRVYINWSSLFHPFESGGILHKLVNLYKRYKNGAGCCDVYSLYYYLGKRILPGLKVFRKNSPGNPMYFFGEDKQMNHKDWLDILDKMIYAFEAIEMDNNCEKIDHKKQGEGFVLFGQYYRDLWF